MRVIYLEGVRSNPFLIGFQQAVFCILMILGNIPFVSTAVVLIRRKHFRKRMADVVKHSHTMRRLVQDIESNRPQSESDAQNSGGLRHRQIGERSQKAKKDGVQRDSSKKLPPLSKSRTYHYSTGFGFVPTPWETKLARNFFKRVFDSLTSELKPENHDYISFKPRLDSKGRFLDLSEHDRLEL